MSACNVVPSFAMPEYLWKRRNEGVSSAQLALNDAEIALTEWGLYWQDNRDMGFGVGYPSMTPFERINHPSSFNAGELALMSPVVELVDVAVHRMPFDYRVLAWIWWVELGGSQYKAAIRYCAAKQVNIGSVNAIRGMLDRVRFGVALAIC
ncbi:hypothetical protein [Thiolinea disciformis]|uniref:hypothetical protein n=1 Tax=Thiolinea disciformis TaxID=125614 RepID=UPI000380E70C|nr:hypothetical protein [Thiolinea disciformis]